MLDLSGREIDRYHLIEKLGEGGMAVVYKAFDTRLECDVAVKFIRMDRITPESSPIVLRRFATEARKTARLTHPNIVPVTDYGEYEGNPYLVMKYLPGGTLKQLAGNPMDWHEALSFILPIAEALDYAHKNGIIHRDVKPGNILITSSGTPMLSDFGIAKVIEAQEETLDHLTVTGVGIGTPEYMAPEQAVGRKVDGRADIYALGVVLYELITGRKPYTADTPLAVILKQANDPLPRPGQFVTIPEGLEHLLFKALAKKPEDRFEDMQVFILQMQKISGIELKIKSFPVVEENVEKSNKKYQLQKKWLWIGILFTIIALLAIFNRQIFPDTSLNPTMQVIDPTIQNTSVPTTVVGTPVLFSDDFQDSGFDGTYNHVKWKCPNGYCQPEYIRQENGTLLLINSSTRQGTAHTLEVEEFWKFSEIDAVEADVMISEFSGESTSEIILQLNVQNGNLDWYTSCNAGGDDRGGYFNCRVRTDGNDDYVSKLTSIQVGRWYKMRIELDKATMAFSYFLDGEKIGSYQPEEAQRIAASDLRVTMATYSNGKNEFSGYVDNLLIFSAGENNQASANQVQVDGVALAVEDFDDQKVNIIDYSAQEYCSIVREGEGNYVLQIDNRKYHDYAGFSFGEGTWQDFTVALRLKLLGDDEQFLIQLRSGAEKYDIVTISPEYVQLLYADGADWQVNTTKVVDVPADVWHQIKFELVEDTISVYIDGILWIKEKTNTQKGDVSIFGVGDGVLQIDDIVVTDKSTTSAAPAKVSVSEYRVDVTDYTRLTLYDDFSNPAYEGLFDTSKWTFGISDESEGKQNQERFVIISRATNPNTGGGGLVVFPEPTVEEINAISVKGLIKEMGGTSFRLVQKIVPRMDTYWHYSCVVEGFSDGLFYSCDVVDFRVDPEERVHKSTTVKLEFNQEYETTIIIDPETMIIRSFLDGELFDIYVPTDHNLFRNHIMLYVLDLYLDGNSSGEGYYDDVYLGTPIDT